VSPGKYGGSLRSNCRPDSFPLQRRESIAQVEIQKNSRIALKLSPSLLKTAAQVDEALRSARQSDPSLTTAEEELLEVRPIFTD
jgi:hypothetical protein